MTGVVFPEPDPGVVVDRSLVQAWPPGPNAGLDPLTFLAGGGEMGERTRAFDWSNSPVGPVAEWPQSLRTGVSICLGSRYPIVLWWGNPAYTTFYNDAYIPVLGVTKHPGWLGRSGRECWAEIWPVIGPMLEGVFATGEATWSEDLQLVLRRNLPAEEGYFTFSYSPILDDVGKAGGIFCAVVETTGRVIGERRLRTLRDLGRTVADGREAADACEVAARTLAANPADIPFALIYLLDTEARSAYLVATSGLEAGATAAPHQIDMGGPVNGLAPWPLRQVLDTAAAELVSDLPIRFGRLPGGPWPESPKAALIVPIAAPGQSRPTGFLVAGLSPRRVLDADYRSFFDLIAGHISTAIANARAHEEERRRAEALAELDRAKTAFFSNVSHEFRTPLTLMLGPVEELLAGAQGELAPRQREELEDTLLDFSRIEAGRVQASYEPTDLPALTADLASTFRSAVERAGLRLVVDCPSLPEDVTVYVDRELWEKIVLNLLSNALKFTFVGEIAVALRAAADRQSVVLTVRDTGTGIPSEELPHLFERFHRVQGARARTQEGSGIGLALVQELVKLHGGEVAVDSAMDQGTAFTVTTPTGKAHLPAERVEAARTLASTALGATPFVEEALRWLPDEENPAERPPHGADEGLATLGLRDASPTAARHTVSGRTARVLLADDNADMRAYVTRLLAQRYEVEAVADGEAALAAARARPPDLVLADVMMPGLDGFALLRALREDPRTRQLPVVLLSARAGEEARVEGIEAGADDYLVKPFAARELLARVGTHLELARVRAEAAEREHAARARAETLAATNADLLAQTEEQMETHVALNAALREAAEARDRALAETQAALRTRDEFMSSISHDLRTPLSSIKGLTQLLLRQVDRGVTLRGSQLTMALTTIDAATSKMAAMIDELLDLARLHAGETLELDRQPTDLVALVQETVVEFQRGAPEHRLMVKTDGAALTGSWDTSRIDRVVANLLSNAIKYSPNGGTITITLAREEADGAAWGTLVVLDEGVGIPAADLPRIFDRFHRGANVTGQIRGSGIGLAGCKQIVELHGGSIAITSAEGDGTTVTVRLPCEASPHTSVPQP